MGIGGLDFQEAWREISRERWGTSLRLRLVPLMNYAKLITDGRIGRRTAGEKQQASYIWTGRGSNSVVWKLQL